MLGFNSNEVDVRKHPSTMFWKFGNQTKTFKGWDKEALQKVEFDPVGKEYPIIGVGWCFSGFSSETNRPIYSVEVPYDQLTIREMEVYTYEGDSKVVLFKGKYDKETTKGLLKDKGANLYLNLHVVVGEGSEAHIETLQVKGLNCGSIMDALRHGNFDEKRFKINGLENKKFKVITYEEIQCGEGKALTKKEKEDMTRLSQELAAYYDAHAGNTGIVSSVEGSKGIIKPAVEEADTDVSRKEIDTNVSRKEEFKTDDDDISLPF